MSYLCVIEQAKAADGRTYFGGYALDLSANVVSKATRAEVVASLREGMALTLLALKQQGLPVLSALTREGDVQKEAPTDELFWLEPANLVG